MSPRDPAVEDVADCTIHHPQRSALIAAAAVVVLDQSTKQWALSQLADGRVVDLIWTLRLRLVYNYGAAFGSFQRLGPVLAVLALAAAAALLAGVAPRAPSGAVAVALGCVAGGALGNVADRIFRAGRGFLGGAVVDFVDVQWWPVWNVADMGVVVGSAAWVWCARRRRD